MPPTMTNPLASSVLLIDGNNKERLYYAEQLRLSHGFLIAEAADGQRGLDNYRSLRPDCVVIELDLPDGSGFQVLMDLVPVANRPNVAVIVLTKLTHPGLRELAIQNGASACLVKQDTSGEDLARAIQRAVALVGQMPKEDRCQPNLSTSQAIHTNS